MSFHISFADVVHEAGVSRQTVPALVDEIIAEGFLCAERQNGARQSQSGLHL